MAIEMHDLAGADASLRRSSPRAGCILSRDRGLHGCPALRHLSPPAPDVTEEM